MVLVTGGSGLLGSALIDALLLTGVPVKAIYHHTPIENAKRKGLITAACDILDVVTLEEEMKDITQVYHCAGLVSFHKEDEQKLFKINVEGTANVVNAALNAGVKKLVHVSSVAAMGRLREDKPVTEKMNWTRETSNSRYGQSKYIGEMEVWRGVAEGLNAVVVNPTIILGPGDWNQGSTALFKSVYDEFPWYSTGTTGFVDVKDVACIMIELMNADIRAERFIISGHTASYQELFNLIADNFGKKRPHKKITPFLAGWATRWIALRSKLTGKKPLVTKETAATSLAKVNFDNSKLFRFFPDFQYRPLTQTVSDVCGALKQKLNK
jgi:dihydroflavonol-4-reductase